MQSSTINKNVKKIEHAIDNSEELFFVYDKHNRIVNSHLYGALGKEKTLCLHAYQTGGSSEKGGIPEWRNFVIEKIGDLTTTNKKFTPPSEGYNPENSNYNPIKKQVSLPSSPTIRPR